MRSLMSVALFGELLSRRSASGSPEFAARTYTRYDATMRTSSDASVRRMMKVSIGDHSDRGSNGEEPGPSPGPAPRVHGVDATPASLALDGPLPVVPEDVRRQGGV